MKDWAGNPFQPLVSIMCTTYNHSKYISQALDGFLMQKTKFPFEVVVHDDASTDDTANIIREYHEKFPHIIQPILEVENQYSKHDGSLRRIVNSHLRGKYVAWCEGDDYWCSSEKLQKQVEYMETHPDCMMCFHAASIETDGKIVKNYLICNEECDIGADRIIEGGGMFCATASLCCRKEQFMQMPKYRLIAKVGDYPLQIMLASLGKVHYYPAIWSVYRFATPNSWTVRNCMSEKQIVHWNNEIEWLTEFDLHTKHKYHNSVMYKKSIDAMAIYLLGKKSAHAEVKKYVREISDPKKRIKCRLKVLKMAVDQKLTMFKKV